MEGSSGGAAFGVASGDGMHPVRSASPLRSNADALLLQEMPEAMRWLRNLEQSALPTGFVAGQVLKPALGNEYLLQLHETMLARVSSLVERNSAADWVWLLRHLDPAVITAATGWARGLEISGFRVAENLTGRSINSTSRLDRQSTWTTERMWAVARLITFAMRIDLIEAWLRRASKNTSFVVKSDSMPTLVHVPELEECINLFDRRSAAQRVERWNRPIGLEDPGGNPATAPLLGVFKLAAGWGITRHWSARPASGNFFNALGQYKVTEYEFEDPSSARLLEQSLQAVGDPALAASAVVLSRSLLVRARRVGGSSGQDLANLGIVVVSRGELLRAIESELTSGATSEWPSMPSHVPSTAAGVVRALSFAAGPYRRSHPGPIIRPWAGELLIADISASTWQLLYGLRVDASFGGQLVNANGFDFEAAIQALVDASPFAPAPDTRRLRGKTLRLLGKSVTDADALLVAGDVLVLISCKRITLSREYDAGEYALVRNAESRVVEAATEWDERIETLRNNRVGDNFDFSSFSDIQGVVVTPEPVYTSNARALDWAGPSLPGLRFVSSADEIADFLSP